MNSYTPVFPKSILFRFHTRCCSCNPTDSYPKIYTISQVVSLPGAHIGQEIMSCSLLALFAPNTTTPTNLTDLQQYVYQFTQDYLNWRLTEFDEALNGIVPISQNALLYDTIFEYSKESCKTRITTGPYIYPTQQLGAQIPDPYSECPDTSPQLVSGREPCIQMFGPPYPSQTSGDTSLDLYLVCLQDGRLVRKFQETVTYDCTCTECGTGCNTNICLVDSFGNTLPGWTVTIYASVGGSVVASGVTGSSGCVTLSIPYSAHTYAITYTFEETVFGPGEGGVYLDCGCTTGGGTFCAMQFCVTSSYGGDPLPGLTVSTYSFDNLVAQGITSPVGSAHPSAGCVYLVTTDPYAVTVTYQGVQYYSATNQTPTCGGTVNISIEACYTTIQVINSVTSMPVNGYTVTIFNSTGDQIAQGVTAGTGMSAGIVNLLIPGTDSDYQVTVVQGMTTYYDESDQTLACSATETIEITP